MHELAIQHTRTDRPRIASVHRLVKPKQNGKLAEIESESTIKQIGQIHQDAQIRSELLKDQNLTLVQQAHLILLKHQKLQRYKATMILLDLTSLCQVQQKQMKGLYKSALEAYQALQGYN